MCRVEPVACLFPFWKRNHKTSRCALCFSNDSAHQITQWMKRLALRTTVFDTLQVKAFSMDDAVDVDIPNTIFPLEWRGAGVTGGLLYNLRIQPVGFWVQEDQLGWIIKQKNGRKWQGLLPPAVDVNPAHPSMSQTAEVPYKPTFCNLVLILVLEITWEGIWRKCLFFLVGTCFGKIEMCEIAFEFFKKGIVKMHSLNRSNMYHQRHAYCTCYFGPWGLWQMNWNIVKNWLRH